MAEKMTTVVPRRKSGRRGVAATTALVLAVLLTILQGAPAWAFRNADVASGGNTQTFTQPAAANVVGTFNTGTVANTAAVGGSTANMGNIGAAVAQFEGFTALQSARQYQVNAAGCARTVADSECLNRGTITISFDRPVTNPLLNVAGLGQNLTTFGGSFLSTALTIATPGVTFSGLDPEASNLQIVGGTKLQTTSLRPSANCSAALPAGTDGFAGCGSVQLTGTFNSITFNTSLLVGTNPLPTGNFAAGQFDSSFLNVTLQDQPLPVASPVTLNGTMSTPVVALSQNVAASVVPANDPATGDAIALNLGSVQFSANGTSGWGRLTQLDSRNARH